MYTPTIGLEVHVTLKTETKMFCGCANNPEEQRPNTNVCPVCLGHPGTLPTVNEKAVRLALKLGFALGGSFARVSKFDRKNYFYPDLPKGYQISQYDEPLIQGGMLRGVRIRRIHLEEDAGRLLHGAKDSLVDFNRAGTPLMELVTEPDIKSADEAVKFAQELQLILRYCEVSDADMEKGQMRVEANISLQRKSEALNSKSETNPKSKIQNHKLGTKVEIKNLNSFRALDEAIQYEISRQIDILERGAEVRQETRGWDDAKNVTVPRRTKEEAEDYRYFPEPDIPQIDLEKFNPEEIRASVPELPEEKRKRFSEEYYLAAEEAALLTEDRALSAYFEAAVSELFLLIDRVIDEKEKESIRLLYNYLTSDLKGLMNDAGIRSVRDTKVQPENIAELVALIGEGRLNSRLAKDMLKEMFETGESPRDVLDRGGALQISDQEILKDAVASTIAENPKAAEDYRKGKENAAQFLFGQAMKKLKGQANPELLNKLLRDLLSK